MDNLLNKISNWSFISSAPVKPASEYTTGSLDPIRYIIAEQNSGNTAIDLSQFNLNDIDFSDINLTGTVLSADNLRAITAGKGDLRGAMLAKGANVKDMPFAGIKMGRSILIALIEGGANLHHIDVSGEDLSGMPLINADFSYANFTDTILDNASLKGAVLTKADLSGASLKKTRLHFANLISAKITEAQIDDAIGKPILNERHSLDKLPMMMRGPDINDFNVYNPKGNRNAGGEYLLTNDGRIQKNSMSNVEIDRQTPHLKISKGYAYQPESFNDEIRFKQGEMNIVCRHTTVTIINDALTNPNKKSIARAFSTKEAMANHVPPSAEKDWENLLLQASQSHVINNNLFGAFLSRQFLEMAAGKISVRAIAITSDNHAMSAILRISENPDGVKKYTVQFTDPNIGEASPVHCKVTNPKQLEDLKLFDFIKDPKKYNLYYGQTNSSSSIYVCDTAVKSGQLPSKAGRKMTLGDQAVLSSFQFAYLMRYNLSDDMLSLFPELQKHSQDDLHHLLGYHETQYELPIETALEHGHTEAITAYGKLLSLISDKKVRAKLLDVEWSKLSSAIGSGNLDAIMAFRKIKSALSG